MIRFNGYPFLEKEDKEDDDHAYVESSGFLLLAAASNGIISDDLFVLMTFSITVDHVMKKDLIVMRSDGMPMSELGTPGIREGKQPILIKHIISLQRKFFNRPTTKASLLSEVKKIKRSLDSSARMS